MGLQLGILFSKLLAFFLRAAGSGFGVWGFGSLEGARNSCRHGFARFKLAKSRPPP